MLPPFDRLRADRLNFATAFRPRSVSTHFMQMTAGNVTLPRPQARQSLGRLANDTVLFDMPPPDDALARVFGSVSV